jgi:hypothetical protein
MGPDGNALARQAAYLDLFYRAVIDADASGWAPWWRPGGYRVDEKSDFGIINADGSPRPGAQLIAGNAARLKTPRTPRQPSTWFTIDRDAHAGGYSRAAFHEGAAAYAQAHHAGRLLGVRSPGTGTDSNRLPVLAVGGRTYNGHNPPRYLNTEFNVLELRDRSGQWRDVADGCTIEVAAGTPVRARASVGNLQEATWLAGSSGERKAGAVALGAAPGSTLEFRRPIDRDTLHLADADLGEFTLADRIAEKVSVIFQMVAEDRAWFGEKRKLVLVAR